MIEKSIPLLVFFLMFIIGASLQAADFKRLKEHPRMILVATLGQVILLPLAAWLLIKLAQPSPEISGGLLLVACCPGGAVSNIYSFLAKANVALSVTLTTINSLFAVVMLPLLVAFIFPVLFNLQTETDGLIKKQSLQLILLLLCPVILGMALRYWQPTIITKAMPLLERLGAIGLLTLLASIFIQFQQQIINQLSALISLAIMFTLISITIAYVMNKILAVNDSDGAAILIEYPVRNLALAALISVSIFNNSEYLLFAAVFFVVQTPIMLAITTRSRRLITASPNP
jgi:BASS family bile acid:Na+ symporter